MINNFQREKEFFIQSETSSMNLQHSEPSIFILTWIPSTIFFAGPEWSFPLFSKYFAKIILVSPTSCLEPTSSCNFDKINFRKDLAFFHICQKRLLISQIDNSEYKIKILTK